jgi:DNA-binding response OmpR family regulator
MRADAHQATRSEQFGNICCAGDDMGHSLHLNVSAASVLVSPSAQDRLPSCLIVEDAALIGMALESYLEDQGFTCEVACSSAAAVRWLNENTPSVAILDYLLTDGPCTALAGLLQARGVPFLIYSGLPAKAACSELRGIPWITKPADRPILLHAISSLVAYSPSPRSA